MHNQQWYAVKNKWTMGKLLSVMLLFVIILSTKHLQKYTYGCIANGGLLPTHVQTFRFVRSTLLFYHIKNSSCQSILTLHAKKDVTKARTLLYTAVHGLPFWCAYQHFVSHFIIKQAIKLNGFKSKQYRWTAPLKLVLYTNLHLW